MGALLEIAPWYKAILALEPCKFNQVFLSTVLVLFFAKTGDSKQLDLLMK
jgi:hypothetical protein